MIILNIVNFVQFANFLGNARRTPIFLFRFCRISRYFTNLSEDYLTVLMRWITGVADCETF